MNRRILKSVLRGRFEVWKATIKDENVRKLVDQNTIISGGSIASLLMNEKVNDFDVYFRNKETVLAVARYYLAVFTEANKSNSDLIKGFHVREEDGPEGQPARVRIRIQSAGMAGEETDQGEYQYFESQPPEVGEEYIEQSIQGNLEEADDLPAERLEDKKGKGKKEKKPRFRPVFLSDNAITLSDKIQIIIRFYGDPEEVHSNFDYVHCMNYWTSWDGELMLRSEALESLLVKQLIYVGSKYPVCSAIRMRKFVKRGWHINAGQILKICLQISELDLNDIKVLEDQLTGVDTAYFTQMISWIKDKQQKDQEFQLNMPYLVSLIDKLF